MFSAIGILFQAFECARLLRILAACLVVAAVNGVFDAGSTSYKNIIFAPGSILSTGCRRIGLALVDAFLSGNRLAGLAVTTGGGAFDAVFAGMECVLVAPGITVMVCSAIRFLFQAFE